MRHYGESDYERIQVSDDTFNCDLHLLQFPVFRNQGRVGETASVPSPECGDGVNPHSGVPYYLPAHRG